MLWTKSGEGREDGTNEQVNKDVKERKIKLKLLGTKCSVTYLAQRLLKYGNTHKQFLKALVCFV